MCCRDTATIPYEKHLILYVFQRVGWLPIKKILIMLLKLKEELGFFYLSFVFSFSQFNVSLNGTVGFTVEVKTYDKIDGVPL